MEALRESDTMATCEWAECADAATHTVDISFPEGVHETWHVCRAHDRELKLQVVRSRSKAPPPTTDTPPRIEVCCGECQQVLDEPKCFQASLAG